VYTRLSLATSVSWNEKGGNQYKTRTERHRIISWNKLAEWASPFPRLNQGQPTNPSTDRIRGAAIP